MSTSTVRKLDPESPSSLTGVKGRRRFVDRAMRVVVFLAFLLAVIPLFWVLWITISRGIGLVISPEWWTTSMRNVGPNDFGGGT